MQPSIDYQTPLNAATKRKLENSLHQQNWTPLPSKYSFNSSPNHLFAVFITISFLVRIKKCFQTNKKITHYLEDKRK